MGVVRVFFHTREWPQPPASPGIRKGPRIVAFERFPAVGVAGLRSVPLARRVIRTFAGMYTYVLTVDLLSRGVQLARHGHHRICSPDRPRVDTWRRTTGGLLEVRRCARVGRALLYQQFGDLFAVACRFRASRRAAAFGHSQTTETGTFRRARFKHGAHEFLGPPHAPGGCPVPRAAHGERVKPYSA